MTATVLDVAIAHLELEPEGWSLSSAGAAKLRHELARRPCLAAEANDLFKLVVQLRADGAPAAAPLLRLLEAQPAVVQAARQLRSQREGGARRVRDAFAALEGRRAKLAPRHDTPRPDGAIPGHALMRPLRPPRRGNLR